MGLRVYLLYGDSHVLIVSISVNIFVVGTKRKNYFLDVQYKRVIVALLCYCLIEYALGVVILI